MADQQLFFDDFDNATVDVSTDPTNGTVTEPAGSELICSIGLGLDARWDGSDYKGVLAYEDIASHVNPNKMWYAEAKLTKIAYSGTTCLGGLCLSNSAKTQALQTGFYPSNKHYYVQYLNGGSHGTYFNTLAGILDDDPSRENLLMRIYYNPGTNRDDAQVIGLGPNEASCWYRGARDAQEVWKHAWTGSISWFTPTRFGVWLRNWSPYPSVDVHHDYLKLVEVDDDLLKVLGGDDNWERNVINRATQGAYEDQAEILTAGGPVRHVAPSVGVGQRVPGPPDQKPGSVGPFDLTAYEDRWELLTAGGPERHLDPQLGVGQHVPGPAEQPATRRGPEEQGAIEDFLYHALGAAPEFRTGTFDVNGRPHFAYATHDRVAAFHLYDTAGEPWANPTLNNFTGYAKDGTRYTSGVQDAGPVYAPWYSEAGGDDRGNRSTFPDRVLVVRKQGEVVLFDLDSYDGTVASLHLWMRFRYDAGWWFAGRPHSVVQAEMHNGVLVLARNHDGTGNGCIQTVDFKRDGEQDCVQLIRSDNHYRLLSSLDITDRNTASWQTTTGVAGARINSESCYRFAVRVTGTVDMDIVCVGEDTLDPKLIKFENNVPQQWFSVSGDAQGESNLNDFWYRNVIFDDAGWLWSTVGPRLFRHLDPDAWYDGPMIEQSVRHNPLQASVELPNKIRWLVAARDYLYAATDVGIYQVNRGTLEFWLAYTVEGMGGGGRTNTPPYGELIVGGNQQIRQLYVLTYAESSYLGIATETGGISVQAPRPQGANGGVTILRLYDDQVIHSAEYSDLVEDGAFGAVMVPG